MNRNIPLVQDNSVNSINTSLCAINRAVGQNGVPEVNVNVNYNVTDEVSADNISPVTSRGVKAALDDLDVSSVGGDGKYISAISETDGKINATETTMDSTPTDNSTKAVTSSGIKTAIDKVKDIMGSLPTDAVLHYSFDEVPDYPDGMAVYYKNEDWSTIDSWQRFTTRGTISVENGILTSTRVDSQWASLERNMSIPAKSIIKIRIKDTSNTGIYVFKKTSSDDYTVLTEQSLQAGIPKEIVLVCDTSAIGIMIRNSGNESSMVAGKLQLEAIYIGDGSYSTPIIDNANGQWNSVSQSGVAVQGVSGKAYKCFAGQEVSIGNIALNTNFSVSIWVKPENTTSNLRGEILRGAGQLIIRNGENGLNKFVVYIWQSGNTATELISSDLLPANIWTHIVVVKNNNVLKVYKNGEQSNNFQLASNILYSPDENYSVANNSNTRSQSYDDLLIFDRALTDTEVMALYLNKANTPKYYDINNYNLKQIKDITAQSTDFADFQSRMAGLATRSLQLIEPTEDER